MKIGIDVDNTITNTIPILKEYCRKYNDEVVKRNLKMNENGYTTRTLYDWTTEENLIFCNRYFHEIFLKVDVKENAREVIEKMKNEFNEIYIITARSEPTVIEPYNVTKKFLDNNNIVYDEIIVNCEDKYKYCKENGIEIMIDDEPKNIRTISEIIPVIVFGGVHNENCKGENVIKVNTWEEVYKEYRNIKEKLDK